MGIFDKREKSAETQFVLDASKEFQAQARRNKALGLWAAEQMGMKTEEREPYAQSVIVADMEEAGDEDVFRKVWGDFQARGVSVDEAGLRAKMDELLFAARRDVAGNKAG